MAVIGSISLARLRQIKRRVGAGLVVTALTVAVVATGVHLVLLLNLSAGLVETTDWPFAQAALAACLVAAAHGLRVARLRLLSDATPVVRLLRAHALAIGAGILVPFKLGEAVRIVLVGDAARSLRAGLRIIWSERILDALAVALVALALIASPGIPPLDASALHLVGAFLLVSLVVLATASASLAMVRLTLLRARETSRTLPALRVLNIVDSFVADIPDAIRRSARPLVLTTSAVWLLEFLAVAILIDPALLEVVLLGTLEVGHLPITAGLLTYLAMRIAVSVLFGGLGLGLRRLANRTS